MHFEFGVAQFAKAIDLTRATLQEYKLVSLIVSRADIRPGLIKPAVQAGQHLQHEVFGCFDVLLVVVEEVLELDYLLKQDAPS